MRKNEKTYPVPVSALVANLFALVARVGGGRSGTYNAADPTAYSHAECFVHFDYDPYLLHDEKQLIDGVVYDTPPSAWYKLEMRDVTWGTEVSMTFQWADGLPKYDRCRGTKVIAFYVDHNCGSSNGAFVVPREKTGRLDCGETEWMKEEEVGEFLIDTLDWSSQLAQSVGFDMQPTLPPDVTEDGDDPDPMGTYMGRNE